MAKVARVRPTLRKDVSLKTFLGRGSGSGESIQMVVSRERFAVIQLWRTIGFPQ